MLPLDPFVVPFLLEELVQVVLEDLFPVLVLDVLEPRVTNQGPEHLVLLAQTVQLLLLLQQLLEPFSLLQSYFPIECYLLPSLLGIISFSGLHLIDVFIEGLLPFTDSPEGLDPRVILDHSIGVFPLPRSAHAHVPQTFLEYQNGILFGHIFK